MSKKSVILLILAGSLVSGIYGIYVKAEGELTCQANNKILLPQGKFCCCDKISATATEERYNCTPTIPVTGVDGKNKCPEGKTRISTAKGDTCICTFTKPTSNK